MKENYKAWQIDLNSFKELKTEVERLKFFLKFAVLAPSSHNSQPWLFSVSENSIQVYRAKFRSLPIADVNNRQLFLSIGCAIEHIVIAAQYYGYSTNVEYKDDLINPNLAAIITFRKEEKKIQTIESLRYIQAILKRKTNRGKYKKEKILENLLEKIEKLKTPNLNIYVISDTEKISRLADIAVQASIESMVDDNFRLELSHHLKHNLTKSKIGMPGFSLGLPTLVSFLLPHLMKQFNLERVAQKQNEKLFKKHTPYIVILTTNGDSRKDWLEAGRVFEQITLTLTHDNISVSPWGAPIQIGEFYRNIQKILHTSFRPQMFFRVGYAQKKARFSPRLIVEDVLDK